MIIWNQTIAEQEIKDFLATHESARLHLQHLWRGFLQIVISNAEMGIHKDTVPPEVYQRMTEIREAVYRMAEELRRIGL